jgi:ketosteroid isomerase-like protein
MKQFLLLNIAPLLLFNACSDFSSVRHAPETKPVVDSAIAKKAVEEGQQIFINLFRNGDSIGVANVYTVDAKVMNAGNPAVEGRDSIIKFFGKIFRSGTKIITVKTIGVWNSADIIVEEGKWIMADKDAKEYDHGKYLILWKMEDGKWKKFRDCHNSDIYPLAK